MLAKTRVRFLSHCFWALFKGYLRLFPTAIKYFYSHLDRDASGSPVGERPHPPEKNKDWALWCLVGQQGRVD